MSRSELRFKALPVKHDRTGGHLAQELLKQKVYLAF